MLRDEAWRRYLRSGERGLQARSRQATRIGTPRSKARDLDPRSTVVVPCHLRLPKKDCDSSETPPSVNDLYLHLHTVNHDRRHSSILDRSGSERDVGSDPATPEQSVDDEAVYLNVAGECSKGRVYGLGSVGRKKRRYGTPGASTSQTPDVHLGMDMDEIGLAQEQPPPPPPTPPPHDQQATPPQIDPADPPQQGDNVGRETTPGLGGRRGGYSGGSELGGGYGGFGASGLGAYREEIVLKVYMHCEGRARKVKRCLKGFQGVEDVERLQSTQGDCEGKQADPLKVLERVREEEP
ncbi:hypothetical protein Sjap_019967 [Stephania japonica]|uniref:Uncharacterized protein n=1 Tax=Stephania japonica TaxID=461633 RepID=A0AAP0F781_9MAGN